MDGNREEKRLIGDPVATIHLKSRHRNYIFDVRKTLSGEHYVTITESVKSYDENGKRKITRNKLFLYKEDFNEFQECIKEITTEAKVLDEVGIIDDEI